MMSLLQKGQRGRQAMQHLFVRGRPRHALLCTYNWTDRSLEHPSLRDEIKHFAELACPCVSNKIKHRGFGPHVHTQSDRNALGHPPVRGRTRHNMTAMHMQVDRHFLGRSPVRGRTKHSAQLAAHHPQSGKYSVSPHG